MVIILHIKTVMASASAIGLKAVLLAKAFIHLKPLKTRRKTMRNFKFNLVSISILSISLILFLGTPSFAGYTPKLPESHIDAHGTPYLTGGIGSTEREQLQEFKADNFSLKIVFAQANGKYTAGTEVIIKDRSGNTVFSNSENDPWLFVDLPDGTYTVEAYLDGVPKTRTVSVNNTRMSNVMFHWKKS